MPRAKREPGPLETEVAQLADLAEKWAGDCTAFANGEIYEAPLNKSYRAYEEQVKKVLKLAREVDEAKR